VFKSRAELPFGHWVEFDDHEWNVKIHWPGQVKAMRPRGFAACERLSTFLKPSFKPTFWDPDLRKKQALTERDFMWFVIAWLTDIGYRTDEAGTCLIVEHGTAAIREAFEERIHRATDGKVRVVKGGMFDKAAHGGQMGGKGSGNFRHKALIEGSFNLIDNYFSGLKGQVGLDRLTCPEELGAREQYFGKLLKAAESHGSTESRPTDLMLPFLGWHEFVRRAMDLMAALNW
jgi:hypothetical protein